MAQTKKQQEEVKQAMQQSPPKDERSYLFDITGCPRYEGYIPKSLGHEVCKYCQRKFRAISPCLVFCKIQR